MSGLHIILVFADNEMRLDDLARAVGPFKTGDDATAWANANAGDWWDVVALESPDVFVPG